MSITTEQEVREFVCKKYTKQYSEMSSELRSLVDSIVSLMVAFINERDNYSNKAHRSGKTFDMFEEFMRAIKLGKTIEWHSEDYVVMSREQYDKLAGLAFERVEL